MNSFFNKFFSLLIVISTLLLLGYFFTPAYAACQNPATQIIFDSVDGYVYGHGARINITDSSATNILVTATDSNCNQIGGSTPVTLSLTRDPNSNILFLNTYLMLTGNPSNSNSNPPNLFVGATFTSGVFILVQYTDGSNTIHYSPLQLIANPDDPRIPPPMPPVDPLKGIPLPPYPDTSIILSPNGCVTQTSGDGICDEWKTPTGLSIPISNKGISTSYTWYCTDDPSVLAQHPTWDLPCPKPNHKDVYLELDWMQNHGPSKVAINSVINAYRDHGIFLHVQYSDEIPHKSTISGPLNGADSTDFTAIKFAYFGNYTDRSSCLGFTPGTSSCNQFIANVLTAKRQVFHYVLFAHNGDGTQASGRSEMVDVAPFGAANDMRISLGSFSYGVGSPDQQAGTFMHELGHNLDLDHGGPNGITTDSSVKCKPNYLSVMSYTRQFSDLFGTYGRPLDYSEEPFKILWMQFQNDVIDSSGFGNAGSVISSSGALASGVFTPGPAGLGQAFQFDSSVPNGSKSIQVANPNNFNSDTNTPFSVSFWINTNTAQTMGVIGKLDSSYHGWTAQVLNTDQVYFALRGVYVSPTQNGMADVQTAGAIKLGAWNHIVITYNGNGHNTGITIYVNGQSAPLTLINDGLGGTSISNTDPVYIGSIRNAGNFLTASIDDIQIYRNNSLSAGNVALLYNNQWPSYQTLWMQLQGTTSDSSQFANDGTILQGLSEVPTSGVFTSGHNVNWQAFQFDSSVPNGSKSIRVANPNNFNSDTNTPFSVSFWINTNTAQTMGVIGKLDSSYHGWTAQVLNTDQVYFALRGYVSPTQNGIADVQTAGAIKLGAWNHIVITYNGNGHNTGITIYVNGQSAPLTLINDGLGGTSISNTDPVYIGSIRNAGNFLTASIDDIQIYKNMNFSSSQTSGLYTFELSSKPNKNMHGWELTLIENSITENPVTSIPMQYTIFANAGTPSPPVRADSPVDWDVDTESSSPDTEPTNLDLITSSFGVSIPGGSAATIQIACPNPGITTFTTLNDWNNLRFNISASSSFADGAGGGANFTLLLLIISIIIFIFVLVLLYWIYRKKRRRV